MRRVRDLDREVGAAYSWLAVTAFGWWIHSVPLTLIGVLGAVASAALYLWQRACLTGVTYNRRLSQSRAVFDERLSLEIEIVNDKLLPLSWIRVEDDVPSLIRIEGGNVVANHSFVDSLVQVLPLLPYQRVRTKVTVVANHRGEFIFGPARLSSGDPVGLRTRSVTLHGVNHLLVYPKVSALAPAGIAARALIGDTAARAALLHDPSRIAGVREYRVGDPLRFVNWRASARSTTLVVREFEPSVTPRVAVFLDMKDPMIGLGRLDAPELEFTVSVAASLVADLVGRKIAVGLFTAGSGSIGALAVRPTSSPDALSSMLDGLARAVPSTGAGFANLLVGEVGHLQRGTSVVTVSMDYSDEMMVAIAQLRRRHAVTAVWVETRRGAKPPPGLVDVVLRATHSDDWQQQEVLELHV